MDKTKSNRNKKYVTADFTVTVGKASTSFKAVVLYIEGAIKKRKVQKTALAHAKKELKLAYINKKGIIKLDILPGLPSSR